MWPFDNAAVTAASAGRDIHALVGLPHPLTLVSGPLAKPLQASDAPSSRST